MQNPFDEELPIGSKIANRYELLSILGKGGIGIVYKARHELIGRIVAVKMLRPQYITDERSRKRFLREAKSASRMDHPHIISVHDFGFTDKQQPYLVMDYAKGLSLSEVLKQEKQLKANRAIHIALQICDALYHAHQRGVIHRDLKPANIMLIQKNNDDDYVMIVDLGVAKIATGEEADLEAITKTGEVCGSPFYLSPEQCKNDILDARSDIYSLGVVIYEMLTGVPPIVGQTSYDTIAMHVNALPQPMSAVCPNMEFPTRLEAIVLKALEKDPNKRQQTMQQFKTELVEALDTAVDSELHILPPDALVRNSHPEIPKQGQIQSRELKISAVPPRPDRISSNSIEMPVANKNKGISPLLVAVVSALSAGFVAAVITFIWMNHSNQNNKVNKEISMTNTVPAKEMIKEKKEIIEEKSISEPQILKSSKISITKSLPAETTNENSQAKSVKKAPEKTISDNAQNFLNFWQQNSGHSQPTEKPPVASVAKAKKLNLTSSKTIELVKPVKSQAKEITPAKNIPLAQGYPNAISQKPAVNAAAQNSVQSPIQNSSGQSDMNPLDPMTQKKQAITLNNEGVNFMRNHDYDAAIAKLLQAIQIDPSYEKARTNLGRAYYNKALEVERSGEMGDSLVLSKQALRNMQRANASSQDIEEVKKHIDRLQDKMQRE